MNRTEKREFLLDAAIRLFNRHGFHATGVDRLMEETGIAKTTLYRHFGSKDGLIVAALEKVDGAAREEMRRFVEKASDDPRGRILATFDQLAIWLADDEFKGCPFVAAATEYAGPTDPVYQQARIYKALSLAFLEELVRAARLPEPKRLARQLMMLHEGATVLALVLGPTGAAADAKQAAKVLIGGERSG